MLNWQNMDYKVLDWGSANNMKHKMKAKVLMNLDFNLSTVYLLEDSSYLIMPMNPFGNSLLTNKKQLLDKWINEQHFPIIDKPNQFYFDNKNKIDNLTDHKKALKEILLSYIFKENEKRISQLSISDIDSIYSILKKQKKIKSIN